MCNSTVHELHGEVHCSMFPRSLYSWGIGVSSCFWRKCCRAGHIPWGLGQKQVLQGEGKTLDLAQSLSWPWCEVCHPGGTTAFPNDPKTRSLIQGSKWAFEQTCCLWQDFCLHYHQKNWLQPRNMGSNASTGCGLHRNQLI